MSSIKRDLVVQWLSEDLFSADIKWTLFISAAKSYRHDTVLRPYPSSFITGEVPHHTKETERLVKLCSEIPCLSAVLKNPASLSDAQVEILHWLLQPRIVKLQICPKEKFADIKSLTGQAGLASEPNFVFEVTYNETHQAKFTELKGDRDVFLAYHGSRVENFHSILHNGLVHSLNKNSLFGEGTYLSAELSITMPYAPCGSGWTNGVIGQSLSCVAVCEIIDDPSVKCKLKDLQNGVGSGQRDQVAGSLGGAVPEKYYVVRNDEMIRVKYLLVYAQKANRPRTSSACWRWVSQHRFLLAMLFYVALLALVGLFSSTAFKNMMRRFQR